MNFSFSGDFFAGLFTGLCAAFALGLFMVSMLRARMKFAELESTSRLQSELTTRNLQLSDITTRLQRHESRYEALLSTNDSLSNDLATLEERIKNYEQQAQQLTHIEERFTASFDSLASRALNASTEQFLALANQNFTVLRAGAQSDLTQKEAAINHLVEPITQALVKVDSKLAELENGRISSSSTMQESLRSLLEAHTALRNETATLSQALRSPNARGAWGEMQLRRVIEFSGMLEHCDFEVQAHRRSNDGITTDGQTSIRPDVIVRLPNRRTVVIDAKTPLNAYLDAQAATDPNVKKEFLRQHAQQLRNQIKSLAAKRYWNQFEESPEFVVLFVPGEVFFSAALESDPSLLEDAFQEKVILATPTTLVALLKAVAYGWRTEKLAENALEIRDLAKLLVERVTIVRDSFESLGNAINKSTEAYNKTVRSLGDKIIAPAQKIISLGGVSEQTLLAPEELPLAIKLPRAELQ